MLPMPGETVALHIFEPRYQELFRRLELGDLEEFGIAAQNSQPLSAETNAEWGSTMRLVFVTPTGASGPRDVVLKCVGLFRIEALHLAPPFSPEPFPTGRIEAITTWKNWRISEHSRSEFDFIARSMGAQMGQPIDETAKKPLITEAMIKLQFNPTEREAVLSKVPGIQMEKHFAQVVRFKRMIHEQEALRKGEHFPN